MSEAIIFRYSLSKRALVLALLYFLLINSAAFLLNSNVPSSALLVSVNIWAIALFFIWTQLRITYAGTRLIWLIPLIGALVAFYVISPATTQGGWPGNHEYTFWKDRMINYYDHFLAGDFFPIWSQSDARGFGTPLPLFYHKLFYYFFTSAYIFIGQVKAALIISLLFFMLIGVIGISRCLSEMNITPQLILPLSLIFLLMNYTSTDWLVRGNMAEFSAMCVVPWLLLWCLQLVSKSKFSWSIIPVLFFLFHAHNIIAYYGVFLIIIAIVLEFYRNRNVQHLLHFGWKGLLSAIAFLLLNAPYFLAMERMSLIYNVGRIRNKMEVSRLYEDFTSYFFDRQYIWGEHVNHISVEINLLFTLILVFILVDLLLNLHKASGSLKSTLSLVRKKWQYPALQFITISLVFLFFLQHPFSIWFYNLIPGADFIQFPWRLLTYISILLILLLAYLLNHGKLRYFNKAALAYLLFFGLLIQYPFMKFSDSDEWKWLPKELIEAKHNDGVWGTAGEYNPSVNGKYIDSPEYYDRLKAYGIESTSEINAVYIDSLSTILSKMYEVEVKEDHTLVVFPFNYSGAEKLKFISGGTTEAIETFRVANDPRVRALLPSGSYRVELTHPTLALALETYLSH